MKSGNMSRIGKKPIEIPEKVEVKIENDTIAVSGPLGELKRTFNNNDVEIKIEKDSVILNPKRNSKSAISLWGTYGSHIRNMINGVLSEFEKKLVVEGVGFKTQLEGANLVLNLGFSHPIKIEVPENIKVSIVLPGF